jgi:SAM-dependent methyltransferase
MAERVDTPYTQNFYDSYAEESLGSARAIVPLITKLLEPQSVIDVGCGIGTWLKAFSEAGVARICGIDGAHVSARQLLIPKETFSAHDLSNPLAVHERFDLAMSVEVAEHLPPSSAKEFVHSLTNLAPVVLFSAAIPHQGGDHHVNEQWPEYWADLFRGYDFETYDFIRPLIWNDTRLAYYYAQNILLFVHKQKKAEIPRLAALTPADGPLARVHPRKWEEANDPKRQHLKKLASALPYSVSNAVRNRFKRAFA